jgi:acyl-CoA thioester hydrolase
MTHIHQFRIYYEDTDSGGVVYYANYLKFAERARTEWLREQGYEQAQLWRENGIGFVVKYCNIQYHAPAFLDDLLQVETSVKLKKASSIIMSQLIKRDDILIASLEVLIVCVNAQFRPQKILLNLA